MQVRNRLWACRRPTGNNRTSGLPEIMDPTGGAQAAPEYKSPRSRDPFVIRYSAYHRLPLLYGARRATLCY